MPTTQTKPTKMPFNHKTEEFPQAKDERKRKVPPIELAKICCLLKYEKARAKYQK